MHPLYTWIQKLHPGTKAKGAGVGGCPLYTWVQKLHRILVWGLKVKNLSMGEKRDLSSKMSFWGPQVVIFIKMPKDLQKQHYTFHVKSEYIHYGRTLYNPISQKNACTTRCFLHDIAEKHTWEMRKVREAPFKKSPPLFGHCPNSIYTPPRTQTGTLGHFFSGAILPFYHFYHFVYHFLWISAPNHPGKGLDPPKIKQMPVWTWKILL